LASIKSFFLACYSAVIVGISTFLGAVMAIICTFIPPLKVKGVNYCAWAWGRFILTASGIKLQVIGAENRDPKKTYIIIANHKSFLDIYALLAGSGLPCRMVAKKELTKIPIFGLMLKRTHTIIIDRKNRKQAVQAMQTIGKALKEYGISVVIFPEGTRIRGRARLGEFKKGSFFLAAQLRMPVLPVTIIGSDDLQPKGAIAIRPGTITLKIDPPITVPPDPKAEDVRELARQCQQIIAANLRAAYPNDVDRQPPASNQPTG